MAWLLALLLFGCPSGDDDDTSVDVGDDRPWWTPRDDDDATPEPPLEPTWTSLHPELIYRCTCHKTNEGGDGGFTGLEDPTLGYASLVGYPSEDLPSMARVEPGDPDRSYAWLKIEGTHLAAGGLGDSMPPTGHLPDEPRAVIREWIELGASSE